MHLVTERPGVLCSQGRRDYINFFSFDTRNEFRLFWRALFKAERATELARHRLASRPSFNMQQAFNYCDIDRDGWISQDDLRNCLAATGFYATDKEVIGVLNRLDHDMDRRVCYQEFLAELSPKLSSCHSF